MKKLFIVAALFLAVGVSSVSAQETPKKKAGFSWNKQCMTELGLNDDVQAKIEIAKKENDVETKSIRTDASLSEDDKKMKLKELQLKRQKAIYSYLTPEELKKSRELAARMKAEKEAAGQ